MTEELSRALSRAISLEADNISLRADLKEALEVIENNAMLNWKEFTDSMRKKWGL